MLINILIILLSIYLLGVFCNYILFKFILHFFNGDIEMKSCFIILGSWYVIIKYYFDKNYTLNHMMKDIIKDMKGGQYGINTRRERNS